MTELPPAKWYPDPQDEDQFRYWDGSAWTQHRAPRHTYEPQGAEATGLSAREPSLRPPGDLVAASFSMLARHWRACVAAAVFSVVAQLLAAGAAVWSAALIVEGGLEKISEILERITAADFDIEAPEHQAYFESIDLDWSVVNLLPAVAGGLIAASLGAWLTAALTRVADCDLSGATMRLSRAFTRAGPRVLRLLGLTAQLTGVAVASYVFLLVLGAAANNALIWVLAVAALAVGVIALIPVVVVATVVACIGPSQRSLPLALRLVRARFWASLGRLLLMVVIIVAGSIAVGTVLTLGGGSAAGAFWWMGTILNAAVGGVSHLLMSFASVVLYKDLGGRSEPDLAEATPSVDTADAESGAQVPEPQVKP